MAAWHRASRPARGDSTAWATPHGNARAWTVAKRETRAPSARRRRGSARPLDEPHRHQVGRDADPLAVDLGVAFAERRSVQNAADAGALAGALLHQGDRREHAIYGKGQTGGYGWTPGDTGPVVIRITS